MLKCKVGYFLEPFLLSAISGYSCVFLGIPGYIRVFHGINIKFFSNIYGRLPNVLVYPVMSVNTQNNGLYPKLRVYPKYPVIPDISGYPLPDDFQYRIR